MTETPFRADAWWHIYGRVIDAGPNRGASHLITYGDSTLTPEEAASEHYVGLVRDFNLALDLVYLGSFDHEPNPVESTRLMEATL